MLYFYRIRKPAIPDLSGVPDKRNHSLHEHSVYRILDANCNRLREALRVIEEYFRFLVSNENASIELKQLRHALVEIERKIGQVSLLEHRDTVTDCFADGNRPEEMIRPTPLDLLRANFKRAQEAARVVEEFAKLTPAPETSGDAKRMRFELYRLEQHYCGNNADG